MRLDPYRTVQLATLRFWAAVVAVGCSGWWIFDNWPRILVKVSKLTTTDYLLLAAIILIAGAWTHMCERLDAIDAKIDGADANADHAFSELSDQRALSEDIKGRLEAVDAGVGLIIAELGEQRDRLGLAKTPLATEPTGRYKTSLRAPLIR